MTIRDSQESTSSHKKIYLKISKNICFSQTQSMSHVEFIKKNLKMS